MTGMLSKRATARAFRHRVDRAHPRFLALVWSGMVGEPLMPTVNMLEAESNLSRLVERWKPAPRPRSSSPGTDDPPRGWWRSSHRRPASGSESPKAGSSSLTRLTPTKPRSPRCSPEMPGEAAARYPHRTLGSGGRPQAAPEGGRIDRGSGERGVCQRGKPLGDRDQACARPRRTERHAGLRAGGARLFSRRRLHAARHSIRARSWRSRNCRSCTPIRSIASWSPRH